eukprot:516577-Rhodomonas_salina.2
MEVAELGQDTVSREEVFEHNQMLHASALPDISVHLDLPSAFEELPTHPVDCSMESLYCFPEPCDSAEGWAAYEQHVDAMSENWY